MNLQKYFIFICAILFGLNMYSQTIGPWDVTELKQAPDWTTTNVSAVDGLTGILYESIDYLDNPVEVFAYYSVPSGTPPEEGWPAVIFVSGGLGEALPEAVEYWNGRGYAAISMDTFGDFPNNDPTPNPGPARSGVFNDWSLDVEDQWYYHAVAQVVRAHSLLASFTEINADKIGIMGASWGGTITGTVMGLDDRLAWALPIYGCGFLKGTTGVQGTAIGGGAKADFVMSNYDGSLFFNNVTFPTLFLTWIKDRHFDLSQNQQSSQAVQGSSGLMYIDGFGHGNLNWIEFEEPYIFAESVINGGVPLPEVGQPYVTEGINEVNVMITSQQEISSVRLLYTTDGDDVQQNLKTWNSVNATISNDIASADIPSNAEIVVFEITDSRGAFVTSEYLIVSNGDSGGGGDDAINLALNGSATQSATANGAEASRAIDGNTNGSFAGGSVIAASAGADGIWWQVDLGQEYSLGDIVIFNRTNSCCTNRLDDFTVLVLDGNGTQTYSKRFTAATINPSITIDVEGAIGQVVRVESHLTLTLNIAELEVYEDSTLGVQDIFNTGKFSMYPNPTFDNVSIDIKALKGDTAEIEILNYAGKTIYSEFVQKGNNTFDLSSFSSGLYVIKVSDGYETYTSKLIKK